MIRSITGAALCDDCALHHYSPPNMILQTPICKSCDAIDTLQEEVTFCSRLLYSFFRESSGDCFSLLFLYFKYCAVFFMISSVSFLLIFASSLKEHSDIQRAISLSPLRPCLKKIENSHECKNIVEFRE